MNSVDGLDGAYSVTVSPDGSHVYAAGHYDNAIAVFSRDSSTGTLTFVEMAKDGVDGVEGLARVNSVTVSPDGSSVYATGFDDQAIIIFTRDPSTGALTFVEMAKDGVNGVEGLTGVTDVAVSPDGSHVYTTGARDYAVAVFSMDSSTATTSLGD